MAPEIAPKKLCTEVMEAIARLCTGRTVIIATHSAQLMGLSGRVIELGGQRLVEHHVG